MPSGEIAYLGLILFAFAAFIGGVLFVSLWTRDARRASTAAAFARSEARSARTAEAAAAPLRKAA